MRGGIQKYFFYGLAGNLLCLFVLGFAAAIFYAF